MLEISTRVKQQSFQPGEERWMLTTISNESSRGDNQVNPAPHRCWPVDREPGDNNGHSALTKKIHGADGETCSRKNSVYAWVRIKAARSLGNMRTSFTWPESSRVGPSCIRNVPVPNKTECFAAEPSGAGG